MNRVLVKVCGLMREVDVETACEAGADAVGFVLADSPRRVSAATCRRLLASVPEGVERVAVFGSARTDEIHAALDLGFDLVQAEHDADLGASERLRILPVLWDGLDLLERLERVPFADRPPESPVRPLVASLASAVTLDGPRGGGRGLMVDVERACAAAMRRAIVLAGGLTPGNVAARVRRVRPFAVDASSGLEHWPGIKTERLMRAFVQAVREAESDDSPLLRPHL